MAKKNSAKKKTTSAPQNKQTSDSSLKVDFNWKKLSKILPIIFIIIAMSFAYYVRSGPISLDGLNDNVEANILSQIQNIIVQQVNAQYPNLDESYKAELAQEKYQEVIDTGIFEYGG